MLRVKLPSPSWANMANENDAKGSRSRTPKAKAVYRPPKLGDRRSMDGQVKIYTKRGWIAPYDPDGDYGGPHTDACDLFLNKRYQSDMRDIYGLPFEPSLAEECRDPAHLRYWDRVRNDEDRHGVYIPPRAPRNQRSRNLRDSYFANVEYSRRKHMTRRAARRRSPSRSRRSPSRSRRSPSRRSPSRSRRA
jgi:hypothetical protein